MPSVVIIGAGLVGAATALALHQAGIQSTLYDQAQPTEPVMDGYPVEFGETGGSVVIQASGLRVLKALGVLEECFEAGRRCSYISWHKIDGSSPLVSDTSTSNRTAGETDPSLLRPLQILRSKLHRILIHACHKAGIATQTGKKLVGVTENESSVTATFADGSTATGDLLIGADGIHSATRRQIFGENCTATFVGSTGYIGVVNIKEHGIDLKETEELAFYTDRDNKRVVTAFKVDAKRVPRVLLVGDAAHGMVPNAGLCLMVGLEDVGTLRALFQRLPDAKQWQRVLELYSTLRVPRCTKTANQARSFRISNTASASTFGGDLNHFIFGLVVYAANAGYFSSYTVFDCEGEVEKLFVEKENEN
ncbi:FAD/NAD(P)-binding domain-containing protein [Rhizoclosmatium globosum]|uniref:FAD/NAD(P)-binding domain-containing protein n=1 Tax=Rhizoclosmatium globosum TaxID=329046 RepID=A0A1Y2C9Y8_9FUNG|nr:FAD/NAD(P)-binding domain-containing protein [Rhizoclosmatium globosum]|eukprot:ORY43849.1 FAD/NAD(P)-binding domain-containing protein [Rhizoclosmatium globosum]